MLLPAPSRSGAVWCGLATLRRPAASRGVYRGAPLPNLGAANGRVRLGRSGPKQQSGRNPRCSKRPQPDRPSQRLTSPEIARLVNDRRRPAVNVIDDPTAPRQAATGGWGQQQEGARRVLCTLPRCAANYRNAYSARTIAIKSAHDRAERPAITAADCPSVKRSSIGGTSLARFSSTRWKIDIVASTATWQPTNTKDYRCVSFHCVKLHT